MRPSRPAPSAAIPTAGTAAAPKAERDGRRTGGTATRELGEPESFRPARSPGREPGALASYPGRGEPPDRPSPPRRSLRDAWVAHADRAGRFIMRNARAAGSRNTGTPTGTYPK